MLAPSVPSLGPIPHVGQVDAVREAEVNRGAQARRDRTFSNLTSENKPYNGGGPRITAASVGLERRRDTLELEDS